MDENYFSKLYAINVSDKIDKKGGLSYLSWAWAWAELKKVHPEAVSTVYENKDGWNYHTDGKTAWVKTGVTVAGIEHIEYLPIMDFKNKSIPVSSITSYDVNKAIQRSMTKAIGRHGLGLSIYAGEDLPEETVSPELESKKNAVIDYLEMSPCPFNDKQRTYAENAINTNDIKALKVCIDGAVKTLKEREEGK